MSETTKFPLMMIVSTITSYGHIWNLRQWSFGWSCRKCSHKSSDIEQHKISDDCLTWHLRCIADEFGEVLTQNFRWSVEGNRRNISTRMTPMHSTLPMIEDAEDQKRMQVLIDSLRIYRVWGEIILTCDNRPLLSLVQLGSILGQIDPLLLILKTFIYHTLLCSQHFRMSV